MGLTVLICDDSILIRKKLRQALESCNCEKIYEAENGVVAVQLANDKKPNLILMDIVMPEKDGIQALEEIIQSNPKAKIVMASSAGTKEHLKKALENGAYDFLQKPITLDALTDLVHKVMKEEEMNV